MSKKNILSGFSKLSRKDKISLLPILNDSKKYLNEVITV